MKKNLLKIFMLVVAFAMNVTGAWAEDQELDATVSATYINAGADNTDTNYSEAGVLYANFSKVDKGVLTDMLSAYGGSDITIVKFDASALPSGAAIKSATVTFTSQCTVSGKNSQLAIVPIGTGWTASEATWNNVDKSADASQVVNLAFSTTTASTQTYDAKAVLNADEDKIVAFAIFTNTGRQQKITNLALKVVYTEEALNNRNYTINAVCGSTVLKQLATGSALENESYKASALPYMIMKDGVCYKLDDSAVSGYEKSFTMPTGSGAVTSTVSYSESDITYFFEAESILSKSYGNGNGAYSGGVTAGVYTGATLTMSSIAAGVYTVTVNSSVRRSNEDIFTVQVSTNGTDWTDAGTITLTSNVAGEYSAENITLVTDGSIRLVESKSQNMCHYVDYVTLKKTDDAPTSISCDVTDAGYATFTPKYDVQIPENVEAYIVKSTNSENIYLTKLEETIKAGTGVILKATADTYDFNITTGAAEVEGNLLKGVTTDTALEENAAYILAYEGGQAVFSKCSAGTLAAGKAYLPASAVSAAGSLKIVIDDEATAIEKVATQNSELKTQNLYNLAGQKVSADYKGIVIKNGKRIVVK